LSSVRIERRRASVSCKLWAMGSDVYEDVILRSEATKDLLRNVPDQESQRGITEVS